MPPEPPVATSARLPDLAPGSRAPDFRAPTNEGHTLGPETFAERVGVVLFFVPDLDDPSDTARVWAFDALLVEFGHRRIQLLGVVAATARELRERLGDVALTLLADADGSIHAAFGADAEPGRVVVVDPGGGVAALLGDGTRVPLGPRDVLDAVDGLDLDDLDDLDDLAG